MGDKWSLEKLVINLGVTPVNGANYLAQLYAGSTLELLRPVGGPTPFQSGFLAGYFFGPAITIPGVPPGSNAIMQVRAWDGLKGTSYEESRAMGGRFGKSELFNMTLSGGFLAPPVNLTGLKIFQLLREDRNLPPA